MAAAPALSAVFSYLPAVLFIAAIIVIAVLAITIVKELAPFLLVMGILYLPILLAHWKDILLGEMSITQLNAIQYYDSLVPQKPEYALIPLIVYWVIFALGFHVRFKSLPVVTFLASMLLYFTGNTLPGTRQYLATLLAHYHPTLATVQQPLIFVTAILLLPTWITLLTEKISENRY